MRFAMGLNHIGNGEACRMTNADYIRSMSDEELAEFLVDVESRRSVCGGGAKWMINEICLEWLKQPREVQDALD